MGYDEKQAFFYLMASLFGVGGLLAFFAGITNRFRTRRCVVQRDEKWSTYESGVAPVANAWQPFQSRLYAIGLVFILLELETILLYPWACVANDAKNNAAENLHLAILGTVFIVVLGTGLLYVIAKGPFFGNKNMASARDKKHHPVPLAHYEKINKKYAKGCSTVLKA